MDERKPVTINAVSLFTGTGALDAAARVALAHFGYRLRTVAYVEKEKFPQQIIRARIEDGLLDAAPIFDNVCTFPGVRFAGLVDAVVAGFPCQPFSVAGKRAGKGDERYLFGEVLRVADEAGAELLLLENVPGLLLEGSGSKTTTESRWVTPQASLFSLQSATWRGTGPRRLSFWMASSIRVRSGSAPRPNAMVVRCLAATGQPAGVGPLGCRATRGRTAVRRNCLTRSRTASGRATTGRRQPKRRT